MQDGRKAVWSILYVSVAFFPSLKHNFIAYRSSSRPDCIFEIQQLWQLGFSRVYSNCCCNCSLEPEIIKIGQSSHEMYSNQILNFQESKSGNLLKAPRRYEVFVYCPTLIQEIWENYGVIHCTFSFYGEVFVKPDSLLQLAKTFGSI